MKRLIALLLALLIVVPCAVAEEDPNAALMDIAREVAPRLSGLCAIAPIVSEWSAGTRTIVLTVAISSVAAWLKPVKDNNHGEA